jgi:hypothetical protein
MRIAYLGLAYHARTGSTRFLLDLLAAHAEVETFFTEADTSAIRRSLAGFDEHAYDAIVVLQVHEAFALLSGRHPNVTYAPMHDAMWRGGAFVWKPSFNAAKVLCFSRALHAEVMRRAPVHAHAQFYPDPDAPHPADTAPGLRGVFWYRRSEIPPAAVFTLTEGTRFERLTIHDAPDPGHEAPFPATVPPHIGRLDRTAWTPDGGPFRAAQEAANVFFAPRPLEGIGMSFLEAMARGLCVVAPDAPTMNEYVSHGVNGLLYAPSRPAPRDFARAREMGVRARADIAAGHARWRAALPAVADFILTPTAVIARRAGRHGVLLRAPAPETPAPTTIARIPPGAAPDPAATWLLLAPPGAEPDTVALTAAAAAVPPEAVVIRGHHLSIARDGTARLHRADDLAAAWARLLSGEAGPEGLGVPEATLIRPAALRDAPLPTTAPALAEWLLDAPGPVHVADAVFSTRPDSAMADRPAWLALAARREGVAAQGRLAATFAAMDAEAAARAAAAAPARKALALIALADRLHPAVGRFAERAVYSPRLRGLLRRIAGR